MRARIKLGIAGLITWMALRIVAAGVAPPRELPADMLQYADYMVRHEATLSVDLLSWAALLTGIIAMIYAGYKRIWPERRVTASTPIEASRD